MSQATQTPPQAPAPFRPPQLGGGPGRVNWLSALAGFAIGAVMASFAWVGVMNVGAGSSSDQGDLVFLGPQGGDAVLGEELDGEGGTQVIRRGGTAGRAGTADTAGTAGGGSAGVAGNLIKLGATVAEDGIARDFLGQVRYGLDKAGRDLTREKLVQTLNSMPPLQTGLTNPDGLRWTEDVRYANHSAQSFRINYSTKFDSWSPMTPYTKDPWLGKDNLLP